MTSAPRGRRSGGRAARKAARSAAHAEVIPYLIRAAPAYDALSDEGLACIEDNAETVLEEVGIDFRGYPTALDLLAGAGANIDGERVRFPKGLCREIVTASAPECFTHHARNPNRNLQIGGDASVFVPAYGSPAAHTLANFETAFGRSEVSHSDSFEQWREEGSLDTASRAHGLWKQKLESYAPPEIDPAADAALLDFVARRRREIPDQAE